MNGDILLQFAGALAIAVAIIHGILEETHVFPETTTTRPRLKLLLRLVWQASTVAWVAFGCLLIALVWLDASQLRKAIIIAAIANFGFGATGNFVATAGRHPGWMLYTLVVVILVWVYPSI